MSNTQEPKTRSVHVPLTQAQWVALKTEAAESEQSIGEVVVRALVRAIPKVEKVTR